VLAPEWTGARVWLARFLLAADERSSAFEQIAFAVEMQPGLDMELEFVRLVAAAGEYEDALARLGRLETRFPDNPELRRARATVLLQMEDLAAAEAEFSRLLGDAYYVDECFWYLGQIAFEQKNYLEAIRYFNRVNSRTWAIPAIRGISQAYVALGDPAKALQVQQNFAEANPKRAFETLQAQADLLLAMGRSDDALQTIGTALEYKPWSVDLWLYRGGIYEQLQQYDQAIKAFSKAVDFGPDNATALNALGYTLTIATKRYKDAQDYIERALKIDPENPAIMDSMGWVLFKQGQLEDSKGWLERAFAMLPDPEVGAHLGEVLWKLGDKAAATEVWNKSRETSPANPVLNETIKRFIP
jgi:tetratricopeptide (TPR) repeat protein